MYVPKGLETVLTAKATGFGRLSLFDACWALQLACWLAAIRTSTDKLLLDLLVCHNRKNTLVFTQIGNVSQSENMINLIYVATINSCQEGKDFYKNISIYTQSQLNHFRL